MVRSCLPGLWPLFSFLRTMFAKVAYFQCFEKFTAILCLKVRDRVIRRIKNYNLEFHLVLCLHLNDDQSVDKLRGGSEGGGRSLDSSLWEETSYLLEVT